MSRFRPAVRAIVHVLTPIGLAFGLLLPGVAAPQLAAAAGPVSLPHGPVPVGEELKPVEFSYISLDATVTPTDGSAVIIDTVTRTRLRNTDKKAGYQRQVTFPGRPVSGVRIGTQNGGLRGVQPSEPWTLNLGPDSDAVIEGTQRLVVDGPVVDLEINWEHLSVWGWPLGAVRLTLHFPSDLQSQQLLLVDPAPTERDTVRLTWSYEKLQPTGTVRVLFIAPQYWRPVAAARQACTNPEASAADCLALATALRPLIDAEDMPAPIVEALQAELLATLRRAVAAGPQEARPHAELAAYLRAHAGGDPALLAEAVAEFKAAYDLAPGDAALKQDLLAALDELMAACRRTGDTRGMLAALDIVEAVAPQGSQERAAAYADLIVRLLDEGRVQEAKDTIVAGFGPEALAPFSGLEPHFSLVAGEIETLIGQRALRFTLVPYAAAQDPAERDLTALVDALGGIPGAQVQRSTADGRTRVELAIPFDTPEELRAAGQALAALPDDADPALRLVVAAAAPSTVSFRAVQQFAGDRLAYEESADLSPAQAALAQRLERLQSIRVEAEAPTDEPVEAARQRWTLALVQRYEDDWQTLVRSCQVSYRLLPPEDIVAPQWTLAWGEQRPLAWSMTIPRYARLRPYIIAIVGLFLAAIVGVAVWQWRRQANRPEEAPLGEPPLEM